MKNKTNRNKKIVEDYDKKDKSFYELADELGLARATVQEIYHREKAKKHEDYKLPGFLKGKYPNLADED